MWPMKLRYAGDARKLDCGVPGGGGGGIVSRRAATAGGRWLPAPTHGVLTGLPSYRGSTPMMANLPHADS